MQSNILMNHVGFPPLANKRFLIKNPAQTRFVVKSIIHCEYQVEYEGELTRLDDEWWEGDFSDLQKPCDYQIFIGEEASRFFVISDSAYDMAQRLMLMYFTVQRCGSPLGWAGMCHQEDGYISETGRWVDLRGGYHQSCDLRKSPGGVPIGVIGMMRWAQLYHPAWDQGTIADEIRWACDYYLKTVQPNGCVYNTLNAPLGWDGRLFYASGAQSTAQWNTLVILAMGAKYFENDAGYSARLLNKAYSIWRYMTREDRPEEAYKHPDVLPRGMDAESFFTASFKDSTSDLCSRLASANALYEASSDSIWVKEIEETADRICARQITGDIKENPAVGAFFLTDNDLRLFGYMKSYGWMPFGVVALCDACTVLPFSAHRADWLHAIELNADLEVRLGDSNPWHNAYNLVSESNMAEPTGHPAPGQKQEYVGDSFVGRPEWGYAEAPGMSREICRCAPISSPSSLGYSAVLLSSAARLLRKPEYLRYAQARLDNILGCNEFDTSSVEGVGHNQSAIPIYGQYFPSTPQIPGGIYHTGAKSKDPKTGVTGEYDMPAVGMVMWAIAELGMRPHNAWNTMLAQWKSTWN